MAHNSVILVCKNECSILWMKFHAVSDFHHIWSIRLSDIFTMLPLYNDEQLTKKSLLFVVFIIFACHFPQLVAVSSDLFQQSEDSGFSSTPLVIWVWMHYVVKGGCSSGSGGLTTSGIAKQSRVFVITVEQLNQQWKTSWNIFENFIIQKVTANKKSFKVLTL